MIHKKISIWEDCGCAMKTDAVMAVYVPDNSPEIDMNRKNKAVLICPGGGYQGLCDREAEPVALAFAGAGICAFVLYYSVAPHRYPMQLMEVSRAMQVIRQNAEAWHVDQNDIAVIGFSAGGHLAAHLAVCWHDTMIAKRLSMPYGDNMPNRVILCYPVISASIEGICRVAFYNLFGDDAGDEDYAAVSAEKFVSADTPPAFIWHTSADAIVSVQHSLIFAQALGGRHVPFELHIYPEGGHGLSLCDLRTSGGRDGLVMPHAAPWFDSCVRWLRKCPAKSMQANAGRHDIGEIEAVLGNTIR